MSQTTQILNHLKREPISPLMALERYGCMRLAARIQNLRDKGYKISTEIIKRNDKRYARYRLVK
jgi:delta 1-pyrroline-5-carboxylate dehydrogenase